MKLPEFNDWVLNFIKEMASSLSGRVFPSKPQPSLFVKKEKMTNATAQPLRLFFFLIDLRLQFPCRYCRFCFHLQKWGANLYSGKF